MSTSAISNDYQFSYAFSFERDFNEEGAINWMMENWTISFWLSGLYIVVIYVGQALMKCRSKYDLRTALIVWSALLAIFSIAATVRLMSEAIYVLYKYGWEYSVCYPSIYYGDSAIWAFLFTVSKAYELGDTGFIILRKQPLIFLHWYHHATVMIYSWYTYAYFYAPGRWFAAINSLVHSFMYTYYALRACRVRVPRPISMSITALQLSQMVFGIYVNWSAQQVSLRGDQCHISDDNIKYSQLMYFSYFVLFAHFFYNAYLKPKDKPAEQTKADQNGDHKIQNGYILNGGGDIKTNGDVVADNKKTR